MESVRLSSPEAIRRAALELLAANPGAPLAEVAARAGVGRATLHRHFSSRDELIRALAIDALDAVDAACAGLEDEPDAGLALEQMFERLVPLAHQFHFLSRCTLDDPEIDRRYARQIDAVAELVVALRQQGLLDPAVPDAWSVTLIDSLIWSAWSAAADGAIPPGRRPGWRPARSCAASAKEKNDDLEREPRSAARRDQRPAGARPAHCRSRRIATRGSSTWRWSGPSAATGSPCARSARWRRRATTWP